ncbi:MAE_28990/MAE_18760 family HEPN-like nuclease [Lysinibacillus tabacifolii]|uniref:RiboL-PSP-HEPN domain-containing protein n=1 Tax=Lysinibacillus tabacifolii TaxID=1173107 RepID=A0ABY2SX60_9BACI|nr:MAE_28990/MAE_18760 family HEPN-like nuclease [Lysinibacillus tabacifolii]TKI46262.1 hypothetical protein FC748_18225 [Lysinibacillus tabacifolii]
MKIRTLEQYFDTISEEKAWRIKELSNCLTMIETSREAHKKMVLRNGVTLLYAHWEGFIKQLSKYYLNYVHYQNHSLNELCPNILALCLKSELNELNSSNKTSLHTTFIKDYFDNLNKKANVPYEKGLYTGANLNSERLSEILCALGIDQKEYEDFYNLIDETLLKNRNAIAHGNFVLIDEIRYKELYDIITNLMFDHFFIGISNLAAQKEYIKEEIRNVAV